MLATLDRAAQNGTQNGPPHKGTGQNSIGVRELRQNASRYLELVEAGEALDVTRNGKVVARLVPVERPDDDPLDELIAAGALRRPEESADLLDVVPALGDSPTAVTDVLAALRAEERW